jgi:hypothetical protein
MPFPLRYGKIARMAEPTPDPRLLLREDLSKEYYAILDVVSSYDGWLLIVKALNSANNQAAIPGKCQPLGVGEGRLDGGEGSGRSRSGHRGHLQGQLGPGHAGPPQAPAMNDARNVWRSPRVSYATVRS